MDYVKGIGGVETDGFRTVLILRKLSISAFCEQFSIDDEDFVARFDEKYWNVSWKWRENIEPAQIKKKYRITKSNQVFIRILIRRSSGG